MFNVGDTLSQAEINGLMSLYCNLHANIVSFDYTDEVIETPYCNLQIMSGLYTDEELIVEDTLEVSITEPTIENCNYYLKINYYDYDADQESDNILILKEGVFLIENGKINFNKMTYIMLNEWKLVVKYNKPCINY